MIALPFITMLLLPFVWLVRKDGGPFFYIQKRVGHKGSLFNCYKIRSMHMDAEKRFNTCIATHPEAARIWDEHQKLPEQYETRVTGIGKFLRKTNMDELPQLFNVLKGDMSIVGPRPMLPEQRHFYGINFAYYIRMRPGITGLWQVSGRNQLTFLQRAEMECEYVRTHSLWRDIVILCKTIPVLLKANPVEDNRA